MKTVKYLFPRFGKMLLVLLIVLSAITVSSVNDEFNVNAWDSNVPHGFVRIKIFDILNGGEERCQELVAGQHGPLNMMVDGHTA